MLTTAFTSATIAFDLDTNPMSRSNAPAFHGYVPDGHKERLKVFLLMFLIKIAHVTSTSMGLSFLFTISPSSAYAYLAASTGVYMLYRACRGDLHYWIPLEGKTGWIMSILERVAAKIIADFTGCIHCRHPVEVGGLYYSLTLLQAQVGSAIFAKLYIDASEGDADALAAEMVYSDCGPRGRAATRCSSLTSRRFTRARSSTHEAPSSTRWTPSTIPRPAIIRRQR